jgi:hemerythrin
MQWKADYETGIEPIDQQHRQLVDTITRLETAASDAQYPEMGRALKFLVDYANYHFSEEELFMQKAGFSEYERHKALHKELIHKLMEMLFMLKKGGTLQPQELLDFLSDWLVRHILAEDMKIGSHVSGQKDNKEAKGSISPAILETGITNKLQKLKTLMEKKLISEEDFEAKKKSLLIQYGSAEAPPDVKTFDRKISFLGTLQKDHLITKEDEKEYKAIVFSQIDPEKFLVQVPEFEKKFIYLKSFHENCFINEETYESLKARLLQDI